MVSVLNSDSDFDFSSLSYHEAKKLLTILSEKIKECEEKKKKFKSEFYDLYSSVITDVTDVYYFMFELRNRVERCLEMVRDIEDCISCRSELLAKKRELMDVLFAVDMFLQFCEKSGRKKVSWL